MTSASEAKRVAIAGVDPSLQSILEDAVAETGHRVIFGNAESVDELARARPDLLLLGTLPRGDAVALLDDLRERSETAGVPVIVLGTLPSIQEQAQASGNVYTVLPMPFELDELVHAVEGALARVPFEARVQAQPASADPAFARAGALLARSERELMLGWVQRIRAVPPYCDRPEIGLREFLNNLPRLLNALALVLPREAGAELMASDEDLQARVREHAQLRVRQGLPGESVVREYQVLRDAIHKHLGRHLAPEDALKALERLNWFLDEVIRITVSEYLRPTSDEPRH